MPGGWTRNHRDNVGGENKSVVEGPVENENELMLRISARQVFKNFEEKIAIAFQVVL